MKKTKTIQYRNQEQALLALIEEATTLTEIGLISRLHRVGGLPWKGSFIHELKDKFIELIGKQLNFKPKEATEKWDGYLLRLMGGLERGTKLIDHPTIIDGLIVSQPYGNDFDIGIGETMIVKPRMPYSYDEIPLFCTRLPTMFHHHSPSEEEDTFIFLIYDDPKFTPLIKKLK